MPETRVITSVTVKPGEADVYSREWSPEYENVNGQPGCVQFELFQSVLTPERFALLEHWESRGAFFSAWMNNVMRPVAGGDVIESKQTEIYFRRKLYEIQGAQPVPADGQRTQEDLDRSGPIRVVANVHSQPGMAHKYIEAWKSVERGKEAGCLQQELFHSTRNPDHLALLALWADRDAFDAHAAAYPDRPHPEHEFAGAPEQRKVGQSGLEIYYRQQIYTWDGSDWRPVGD